MTQSNETGTRRRFLKFVAAGAVALPAAASLLRSGSAKAAEAGQLDEADPAAAALGYKKDTTQVDAAKVSAAQTHASLRRLPLLSGQGRF